MGRALSPPLRVSGRPVSNLPQFFKKAHGRHIVFPVHGSTAWPRQGPSPHLTRETTITCTLLAQVIVINLLKHQMYQTSNKHTLTNTLSHIQHISNTYESTEWPRQGPPPHLTRETFSGRRPADGADTPGGVFRSGENLPGEGDTADIFRRRRRE